MFSKFKIMKTVNSISGGKTSAYIAVHYPADYEVFSVVCIDDKECTPKDKAIVDYANRKLEKLIPKYGEFIATAEDDATLKAMMDLEQYLGREIIWVRGKSFDDVIDTGTQTRLPSWARRYCTEQMKLQPIFDWWFNEFARGDIVGGFYYHIYQDKPEKNKLVVMPLKEILKRKPQYASAEFWGGEKDSYRDW